LGQESPQAPGPLGRNGVPGPEPGVRQALLLVPGVVEKTAGHGGAVGFIPRTGGGQPLLVPGKETGDDLLVVHWASSLRYFLGKVLSPGKTRFSLCGHKGGNRKRRTQSSLRASSVIGNFTPPGRRTCRARPR